MGYKDTGLGPRVHPCCPGYTSLFPSIYPSEIYTFGPRYIHSASWMHTHISSGPCMHDSILGIAVFIPISCSACTGNSSCLQQHGTAARLARPSALLAPRFAIELLAKLVFEYSGTSSEHRHRHRQRGRGRGQMAAGKQRRESYRDADWGSLADHAPTPPKTPWEDGRFMTR